MANIARVLNQKWGVNAVSQFYRENGSWYHELKRFPGALFDKHGYVLFQTADDYDKCPALIPSKKADKDHLTVKGGISILPGYVLVSPDLFVSPSEYTDISDDGIELLEGGKTTVVVNRFERDPKARKACIAEFGAICSVCRFDFSKAYGPIGQDFIHVHHLIPLSARREKYVVNPTQDLRPVCPNCHEMLHRGKPEPFTLEELKVRMKLASDSGG